MFQSHIIELSGRVAGAAVSAAGGFRFIAIDPRLEELDGSAWASVDALRLAADHLARTGSLPCRAAAVT